MNILHIEGGLGNQLYIYAMYKLLKSTGNEVKLDMDAYSDNPRGQKEVRKFELDKFGGVIYETCTAAEREKLLDNSRFIFSRIRRKFLGSKEKSFYEKEDYQPEILKLDNTYIEGYWQCDKYYKDIYAEIRESLVFPQTNNPKNIELMQKLKNENSVSLHIRRGDFYDEKHSSTYEGICTEAYYEAALKYIKENVENPVFYIFSDDKEYVLDKYKDENMTIVDWNKGDDSIYDMQLMSCCKYNICANSSFSSWGAILNNTKEKIMIRPLYMNNNQRSNTVKTMKALWPDWIMIDEKGQL